MLATDDEADIVAASGEPRNELTFLLTEHGRPFKSAAAFGNKFADWCEQAGLTPVLCEAGLDIHPGAGL